MAVFPCDRTGHRYPGPQRSIYLSRVQGMDVRTRKQRLCRPHFEETLAIAADVLEPLLENTQASPICSSCGAEREVTVYLRLYEMGDEPALWAGDFCAVHADGVADRMLGGTQRGL